METKQRGTSCAAPGSTLDLGDYVHIRGDWYLIAEELGAVRNDVTGCTYTRSVRGVRKDGKRLAFHLTSATVKAWRAHR